MGADNVHDFRKNKKIPLQYEQAILEVLAAYPELRDTHIHFVLKDRHPVPYGTVPTFPSLFRKPSRRVYQVSIREKAKPPIEKVLFRNLSYEAQKGVIAHELIHVLQFQSCSIPQLLKTVLKYPFGAFQRQIERDADKGAIERGFGRELYTHASYIRSVPGYTEKRKAIHKNYLEPREILEYMAEIGK